MAMRTRNNLRRLRRHYSLVRRVGGDNPAWTPASIPGIKAWYDASQLGTADGTLIGTMPDLSGGGNAATQGTTAYKPAVDDSYNLLSLAQSESLSGWSINAASLATDGTLDPMGFGVSAQKLVEDNTSTIHYLKIIPATPSSGNTDTFSVYCKTAGRDVELTIQESGSTQTSLDADLSAGKILSGSGTITDVGGGWYRLSFSRTSAVGGNYTLEIRTVNGGSHSYAGDGTSGIYIWGAQIVQGSAPLPYDHTRTTGAINGLRALKFDGVADYLSCGDLFSAPTDSLDLTFVFSSNYTANYSYLFGSSDSSNDIVAVAFNDNGSAASPGDILLFVRRAGTYSVQRYASVPSAFDGNPHVIRFAADLATPANTKFYLDGTEHALTAGTADSGSNISFAGVSTPSFLGCLNGKGTAANFTDANVAEVVILSSGLMSSSDASTLTGYLKQKWGVA